MIPLSKGVKILKQDANGLLALYKPAAVLSHPNNGNAMAHNARSVINGPYNFGGEYFTAPSTIVDGKEQDGQRIWLINRLDLATSGVILASTNQAVAEAVKEELKMRRVQKSYSALVFNQCLHIHPKKIGQSFSWVNNLSISKADNRIVTKGGSADNQVTAETKVHFTKIQNRDDARDRANDHFPLMMLDLQPLTGYSHQLRFQAAQHGYPIVGDPVYGDFRGNKRFRANFRDHLLNTVDPKHVDDDRIDYNTRTKNPTKSFRNYFGRLFLHARKVEFTYELDGQMYEFSAECPLPRIFDAVYPGTFRSS